MSLRDQQQAYAALQQAHRAASAQVQQNAAQHLREQRKALLGSPDPSAKQKQMHDSGQVLGVSKDITQGLRRTKQLLSQVMPKVQEAAWLRPCSVGGGGGGGQPCSSSRVSRALKFSGSYITAL